MRPLLCLLFLASPLLADDPLVPPANPPAKTQADADAAKSSANDTAGVVSAAFGVENARWTALKSREDALEARLNIAILAADPLLTLFPWFTVADPRATAKISLNAAASGMNEAQNAYNQGQSAYQAGDWSGAVNLYQLANDLVWSCMPDVGSANVNSTRSETAANALEYALASLGY